MNNNTNNNNNNNNKKNQISNGQIIVAKTKND